MGKVLRWWSGGMEERPMHGYVVLCWGGEDWAHLRRARRQRLSLRRKSSNANAARDTVH